VGQAPRRLIYQVAVGEVPAFYASCLESVARYAARIWADHVVQTEPILRIVPERSARSGNALRLGYLPIYEKEVALSYLDRYEQILVLDADVWVRPEAPDIFGELGSAAFAGVLERDLPLLPKHREKLRKHSEGQFRALTDVDWRWNQDGAAFWNMGVMLIGQPLVPYLRGQAPGEFLRRPEFARFVNGEGHWRWSTDQTLLNWWIRSSGMPARDLDWRWNALHGACETLAAAHFVHFFLSAKLPRGGAEIPDMIRRL
jgi:hypothetical protein